MALSIDTTYVQCNREIEAVLDRTLFFIAGCQRSGTTWLQNTLNGHPAIRCDGEARFANVLLPMLKDLIEQYNGLQQTGPHGQFDSDDLKHLFRTAVGLMYCRWTREFTGIEAIGEKTPENALSLGVLDEAFAGLKVVHIIRDPRDVIVSGWFHNLRKGEARFRQAYPTMDSYTAYTLEHHWLHYIRHARAFGQLHPDRYHEIRYEDLYTDTAATLRGVLEFLGVDASEAMIQRCLDAGAFERLSGGRERGAEDRASFFRKGVIGDWRNHLSAQHVEIITRVGGRVVHELGYV